MEHLDLFSDKGGQVPPNSKAAQAVAALDALLQDLAVFEEVQPYLPCSMLCPGGWGGEMRGPGAGVAGAGVWSGGEGGIGGGLTGNGLGNM